MTAEEYWNSEGIRFLNADGTLPSTEERVKEGYQRGWENGWERADQVRDDQERRIRQSETPRTDAVFYSFHNHEDLVALARELEKEVTEKTNEVARLRDEIERYKRGVQGLCYACEPVAEMNHKLEADVAMLREENEQLTDLFEYYYNCFDEADVERMDLEEEVERLRELMNRAIKYTKDALFFARSYENKIQWNEIDKLWDEIRDLEKEALAPEPEEPVTQDESSDAVRYADHILNHYDRNSEKDKLCLAKDLLRHGWNNGQPNAPAPEEAVSKCNNPFTDPYKRPTCVTCDRMDKMVWHSDTLEWVCENTHELRCFGPYPVPEWRELGPDEVICEGDEFLGDYDGWMKCELYVGKRAELLGRVRTRRPLPKQEEMPLTMIESSLKLIEGDGKYPLDHDEMFGEVVFCIRYLRAEVQRAIEDRNRIGIEIRGEYLPKLKDQDNEVARLREENECFKRGCQGSCYACEPVGEMNLKLEAEVARLRELLNRAIEIGKITTEYIEDPDRRKHYRSAIQEIATAPEEPVIQENRITEPEWREFGPDEVIKEGEWYRRHYGEWVKVWITEGDRVCMHKGLRFRTRRPLPNPSEPPKSSKQEEMPLEDELKDIDQYADKQNDFHTCRVFQSIEYSLHYLRDEIQKLKEAR
jgi:hypothetical protein